VTRRISNSKSRTNAKKKLKNWFLTGFEGWKFYRRTMIFFKKWPTRSSQNGTDNVLNKSSQSFHLWEKVLYSEKIRKKGYHAVSLQKIEQMIKIVEIGCNLIKRTTEKFIHEFLHFYKSKICPVLKKLVTARKTKNN
jgi:hypothetical protein